MSSAPLPSPIDDDDRKSVVSSIAKVDSHTPADHVYPELSTARAVLLVASMTLTVVLHTASIQGTVLSLTHMGQDFNMAPASYQWCALGVTWHATSCTSADPYRSQAHARLLTRVQLASFALWPLGGCSWPQTVRLLVRAPLIPLTLSALRAEYTSLAWPGSLCSA